MKQRIVIIIAVLMAVFTATMLLSSCKDDGGFSKVFTTPIDEIVSSPQHFNNRTITIAGVEMCSGGTGKKLAYLVDDSTGSIWVLDKSSATAIAEQVRIRGQPTQCSESEIKVLPCSKG